MNKKLVIGGGVAAVVVLAAAVWFLFFRSDAPDEVSVEAANAQLDEDLAASADEPAAGFDGDVNGTWIVDDETHWVFQGTGFQNGDDVPALLGYEPDAYDPNFVGACSQDFTLLSSSPFI